jgi:hypothetical protein
MNIIVKLPSAYFTDGRVSTDELSQRLFQGLWKQTGVIPADIKVSLHDGSAALATGCDASDVLKILGLGEKPCTQTN